MKVSETSIKRISFNMEDIREALEKFYKEKTGFSFPPGEPQVVMNSRFENGIKFVFSQEE